MDRKFRKRILSYFLAWLMVIPGASPHALAKGNSDTRRAEEVKAAVLKLGAGKDARVLVVLRDNERVGGYVQQNQEDDFSVRVFCSGSYIPVRFVQIKGLRGVNVATETKVSAGKGVSEKSAAGLAADDPCGMVNIQTWGPRSSPLRTAAIIAAFATLGLAVVTIIIGVVQEHNA